MLERSNVGSGFTEPIANPSVRSKWRQQLAAMAAFAMDDDGGVFCKVSQQVRLDLVLVVLAVVARPLSC